MLELAARTDSPSVTGTGLELAECEPCSWCASVQELVGPLHWLCPVAGPSSGFGVRAAAGAGPTLDLPRALLLAVALELGLELVLVHATYLSSSLLVMFWIKRTEMERRVPVVGGD